MQEFRAKIERNGRMVLPVACRRQLHLAAGETIIIRIDNEELRLFTLKHAIKKAQALVQERTKGRNLVDELITMRREEAKREDAQND